MQAQDTETYETAMKLALEASQKNDTQTALDLFMSAAKMEPSSPIPHFLMAAEYMEIGELAKAEACYAQTLLLNPELAIARFQFGLMLLTSERTAMALLTWEPLLKLSNDNSLRLFAEGFANLITSEHAKAKECFEQGIINNTENIPLNLDIQRVLGNINALQEATEPSTTNEASSENTVAEEIVEETGSHVLLSNYQQLGTLH